MPPNRPNPFVLPPKPEGPRQVDSQPVQRPVVIEPSAAPEQPAPKNQPAPENQPPQPGTPDYGFIMEPEKPQRTPVQMPGFGSSSSMLTRVGVVLGGLLILLIILAVGKSIFSGSGNTPALTAVAQQQQSMIHILTNGAGEDSRQQATLSDSNKNFAATAQLTLTSAQQQLIQYMANNGKKVNDKVLALKIDPTIDEQLTTAAGNSTYDSTFKQVMQDQLTRYEKALQAAYQQTSGPKGRALLQDEFQSAQMLLTQLDSPAS